VGLNVGHVVSCGGNYLGWQAKRARRVVYIDGEMPGSVLKDRYATIVAGSETDPPEENFRLVASAQTDGLPDLSDPAHQRFYDDEIRNADLIIVDNLSTICRSHRENEADSWAPVQAWCLRAAKNANAADTSESARDSIPNSGQVLPPHRLYRLWMLFCC
jgi:hypothetical protein